jgi:alkanesulfonate monooxygenase SsuD/methylene tetrahydromethanopterin reductase-like flavin-dependent oxidoreductase (luciferase family)
MSLRLGTLCLFENPSDEAGRALIRQFVLVREADRMGYDDIWMAERHGDARRPSGAITTLLGHLAGVTSKARIGAVLQPQGRDPVQLAEDLATAALLSRERLALAADALGEPGSRALDALAVVRDALAGGAAEPVPRPPAAQAPAWALTDEPDAARRAAALGLGLWLPPWLGEQAVAALVAAYRDAAGEGADPRTLLTRYACPCATREAALEIARPYLGALPGPAQADAVLAQSLVGSHAEVAAQIKRLEAGLGLHGVVVVPMSAQFDTAKHILADMVDEVRPLLD